MSKKKAGGSTRLGRDSAPKYLGVKRFGSQFVRAGEVLVRQRGSKFHAGANVKQTADDTLISLVDGIVNFSKKKVIAFTGNLKRRRFVSVEPLTVEASTPTPAPKKATKKKAVTKKTDDVEEAKAPKKSTTKTKVKA